MKRLYKRLAATFLFSALLSVVIFAVSLYWRGIKENGRSLDQLLVSVESNFERANREYNEKIEHLREDYLSRVRAVEYIVSHDDQMIDRSGLEILKSLMETGDISLIDSSGRIFLSTSETLQDSQEESSVLEALEQAPEGEKTAVRIDQADFRKRPEYFYAVSGSESEQFSAVRVDADLSRAGLVSGKELVGSILRQATTEYETSIFAVGKERGKVFGITENNNQKISIRNVKEGEEMLDYLSGIPKERPVLLYVNGAWQSAVVRDLEEMYLVAFTGMDRIAGNVLLSFWLGLAVIGTVSVLTVLIVRHHLKKYLFRHFEQIREGIYGVIRGERDLKEGDRVLRRFAGCLSETFRQGDVTGRIGGDEFVVLIPNSMQLGILEEKFVILLEEIRRALGEWYEKYRVSASIGAVLVDGTVRDYKKLYRCADTALYISKYLGKDCFYINEKMIDCMRRECIGCRTDCPRSSILRD